MLENMKRSNDNIIHIHMLSVLQYNSCFQNFIRNRRNLHFLKDLNISRLCDSIFTKTYIYDVYG